MKKENGITLVSLIITIVLMLIIAGVTVNTSVDRFKINNVSKMHNDIEILNDKVNNYYVTYGGLPVVRDNSGNAVQYTYSTIDFNTNVNDNANYYIIDLSALGNLTLNYGKDGYRQPNSSDDVYIINEKTHSIYYVKGIENRRGTFNHSYGINNDTLQDTVPPTTPQVKVVEGKLDQDQTNTAADLYYKTAVTVEFIPGKDSVSGIDRTTYSVNGTSEANITALTNNRYSMSSNGTYVITAKTYDNSGNVSQTTVTIHINQ